jgi:anti-sigma28 factor (negative regulator of flagellin synthesis)
MQDVMSVSGSATDPTQVERSRAAAAATQQRRAAEAAQTSAAESVEDRVELSAAAQSYDPAAAAEQALQRRIVDIRAQIEAGTYLTEDKLDVVVQRLHAELFGE